MRCIFCAEPSNGSRSREHILPESLGNVDHVLPPGVVCDGCNNYFAIKVERPLLETPYFVSLRSRQTVANKRGLLPLVQGVFPAGRMAIGLQRTEDGLSIGALREADSDAFVRAIMSRASGRFYVVEPPPVDEKLMARFLAKVGLEILASRLLHSEIQPEDLLHVEELCGLRRFARRGDSPRSWPIHKRRIYDEDAVFGAEQYQVLHELDLLHTNRDEWYAIVCLFGEEFAINLGGPSIEGYERYLVASRGVSPLYKAGELERLQGGGAGANES